MEIRITKATKTDLQFLEHVEKTCFYEYQQSSRKILLTSVISPAQGTFIAQFKEKNKWISAGTLVLHYHKKTLRLYSIAVLPQYQDKHIGKHLMDYTINFATAKKYDKVSLEVLSTNRKLIGWYQKVGFICKDEMPDYYAPGINAIKMVLKLKNKEHKATIDNIIVMDTPKKDFLQIDNIQIVSAKKYISNKKYQELESARVFNLCSSYKYQSLGYYVSLLASARDHRVIPSVTTITDFKSISVIKSISVELDAQIQKNLETVNEPKYVLNIYFGHTVSDKFKHLGQRLYNLFETPLLQVTFTRGDHWFISRVMPLPLSKIDEPDKNLLKQFAEQYFNKKRFYKPRLKYYKYDMAILVNPNEKNPPSDKKALEKFKAAAERNGFFVEFITKDDFHRICEFDALFIRETTTVNNYTYQFSRVAYAEGLVVIDDPWSILRCSNKIFLNERMEQNKIPIPPYHILSKSSFDEKEAERMQFPLVLKQPDSSFSLGVTKVNNKTELIESLKQLFKTSELILAQSFMPSEYDWRIGVLDQQPLFACKYYMAKNHWQIYNWAGEKDDQLGNFETIAIGNVPKNVLKTAVKAASLMGDGLYGVDLKEVNGKVFLIEVNDNPNIDSEIEDSVLKDELYNRVILSFLNRIEMGRNMSRYIAADPV